MSAIFGDSKPALQPKRKTNPKPKPTGAQSVMKPSPVLAPLPTTHPDPVVQRWLTVPDRNLVARMLRRADREAEYVARRKQLICYLSGPGGVGKTRAVRRALMIMGFDPNDPRLYVNPRDYIQVLQSFKSAHKHGHPLVFDEADIIFKTVRQLNLMNVATDRDGSRVYQGVSLKAPMFVTTNGHYCITKIHHDIGFI